MPSNRGPQIFEAVNTYPPAPARNVYRQSSIEIIFGQVWTRPGLTRRQRRWVSLTAAGATGTPVGTTAHIYGAINSDDISVEEMGEFILHFACYAGWPRATLLDSVLDAVIERMADERGEPAAPREFAALRREPLTELADFGAEERGAVLGRHEVASGRPTPLSDVYDDALIYGQVWSRPQLPRADRRLITVTYLSIERDADALRAHLAAAWEAGELDAVALGEVALHAAFYAGGAAGRAIDTAVGHVLAERSAPGTA